MKITNLLLSSTLAFIVMATDALRFYMKFNGLMWPLYSYCCMLDNGEVLYVLSFGQQAIQSAQFTLQNNNAVTPENFPLGIYHHVLSFGRNRRGLSLLFDDNMRLDIGQLNLCPDVQGKWFSIHVGTTLPYSSSCFDVELFLLPDCEYVPAYGPHLLISRGLDQKIKGTIDSKESEEEKIPRFWDTVIF